MPSASRPRLGRLVLFTPGPFHPARMLRRLGDVHGAGAAAIWQRDNAAVGPRHDDDSGADAADTRSAADARADAVVLSRGPVRVSRLAVRWGRAWGRAVPRPLAEDAPSPHRCLTFGVRAGTQATTKRRAAGTTTIATT